MAVTINASTTAGLVQTADTSGVLALQTAGTTAVTVDASQRVGIGTASPATKVDNTGSFRSTGVTDPVSGAGLELCYRGTVADVLSYNRDTSQFTELQVRGSPIAFLNAGGERARIPATGGIQSVNSISVGNTAPTTSGAGITFPATQSASSDVNTLDDYEEGNWTPAFTATGSSFSYAYQSGYYTKVGKLVTVMGAVSLNSSGNTFNSSALSISGLPFTQQAGALYWFITPVRFTSVATANYGGIGVLSTGTSVDLFLYTASATTPATMLANNLTNSSAVIVNFTYSSA